MLVTPPSNHLIKRRVLAIQHRVPFFEPVQFAGDFGPEFLRVGDAAGIHLLVLLEALDVRRARQKPAAAERRGFPGRWFRIARRRMIMGEWGSSRVFAIRRRRQAKRPRERTFPNPPARATLGRWTPPCSTTRCRRSASRRRRPSRAIPRACWSSNARRGGCGTISSASCRICCRRARGSSATTRRCSRPACACADPPAASSNACCCIPIWRATAAANLVVPAQARQKISRGRDLRRGGRFHRHGARKTGRWPRARAL